jgi:hypothetical protein
MASQSAENRADPQGQRQYAGQGIVLFAALMLLLAGVINVAAWFVTLISSTFYPPNGTYLFGDVRTWGWIQLLIGVVQLVACFAILSGQPWGRWLGIGIAMLSVLGQLFFVNASPIWTLTVSGIDIIILYGLARYGVAPFAQAGATAGESGDVSAVPAGGTATERADAEGSARGAEQESGEEPVGGAGGEATGGDPGAGVNGRTRS